MSEPPLPARVGQQLGIFATRYQALIERLLAPHDLTFAQFAVLLHLARRGEPGRVSEVAAAVELTQPAVTKILQKFASLGLVEILRDARDGRNRPARITAAGLARVGDVQRSFAPAFDRLLAGWTADGLEHLITDLSRLTARMDEMGR